MTLQLPLMDVVMSRMSGRDLAHRLSKIYPDTRLVYMLGCGDNVIIHHDILELVCPFSKNRYAKCPGTERPPGVGGEPIQWVKVGLKRNYACKSFLLSTEGERSLKESRCRKENP